MRKSVIFKKGYRYSMALPRTVLRFFPQAKDHMNNPPVVANSFPKSGTHMLLPILRGLPGMRDWGLFLASMPSVTFREIPAERMRYKIRNLAPKELVGAHLFYSKEVSRALAERGACHYFIFRDPRDVVISEAYYLSQMNRWHRLSKYFRRLKTIEERIFFSIIGAEEEEFPYDYQNIGKRYEKYLKWITDTDVFAIKYEELNSARMAEIIQRIFEFYVDRIDSDIDAKQFISDAIKNASPKKSHTFREGKSGGWRENFTSRHKEVFKDLAGKLLIDLKYETNLDW